MKDAPHPSLRYGCALACVCPALLIGMALLQGCSALRGHKKEEKAPQATEAVSFKVDVVSDNHRVARYLERHLDIQRFADFPDLQAGELRRLLGQTESNARDLLAALGYFNPTLDLKAGEPSAAGAKRRIVIEVDPGEQAKVEKYDIRFAEPMNSNAQGERQRRNIRRDWLLRDGNDFTQEAWSSAKTAGLRTLQRERYPTARIAGSQATVNADTNRAALEVTYDAGPPYRFGMLKLEGLERYNAAGIYNIARIPTGQVYKEESLLDSQQRLVTSGYFDSVFLTLDNSERNPDEATVIAQLREAKLQKMVFGFGFSTDTGPRLSIDHTHNKMWPLRWRAVNQFAMGTQTQSLATAWTDMPNASGWAWNTGLKLERSDVGDIKADSASLMAGRSHLGDKTESRYYLQYDASNAEGGDAPRTSSSLMGNYAWTGRYFNDRISPTSGDGIGFDAGVGVTVSPERKPFLRLNARALELWPFGGRNAANKRSRLALRAEAGAVYAANEVNIPARLLFLTGGDTTVRGYSYQSIGTRLPDGSIYGARYMAMASVEWQHPITLFGDSRSFEHTVFVDAGTAADKPRNAVIFPAVGAGMRWASPVGPLQVDLAYGIKTEKWRVHLRMGFQFQ
jgi:translocation and assembly module TamA